MTQKLSNYNNIFPKYLSYIIGIYTCFFTMPTILLKYSVILPYFGITPISILLTGTYFVLLDVITEVYGYIEAKKAIYTGLFGYSIFVFLMEFTINLTPIFPLEHMQKTINNEAYNLIFSHIYQTWLSVVICTIIFDIFNARLLTKLKFLFNGRYFILRSIGSSSLAIIMFTLVTNLVAFHKEIFKFGVGFYIELNEVSLIAKILSLILFSFPALLLCKWLKKQENIDTLQDINIWMFTKKE